MSIVALGRFYQHSFDSHPHATLAAANATLSSIGDAVAQLSQILTNKSPGQPIVSYDIQRTCRFFLFGACMGPLIGRWNKFLEIKFPLRPLQLPASHPVSPLALAKRVASDQILMAPAGIAIFLGSMGVMEGRSGEQIKQKYSDLYFPALFANWKVWPLAQTCGVFWTLYLSLLNSSEDKKQDDQVQYRKTLDS